MLNRLTILILVCFISIPAHAQPALPQYSPPDRELWEALGKSFSDLSMPLSAHQAIQNIMQNVQREAQMREMRARATTAKPEVTSPPK